MTAIILLLMYAAIGIFAIGYVLGMHRVHEHIRHEVSPVVRAGSGFATTEDREDFDLRR